MPKKLFIADDDADIITLLTFHGEQVGFSVASASDAMSALQQIETYRPDVVILDVDMPSGNGLSVREMMNHHKDLKSIPVIMLTASENEETIRRCHEQCSFYVLKCPNVWSRVEPVLRDLFCCEEENVETRSSSKSMENSKVKAPKMNGIMNAVFAILGAEEGDTMWEDSSSMMPRTDEPWILSIEDDDDFATALRIRLREYGVNVVRASNGRDGYRQSILDAPRAIILDYEMPEGNGDYVLRRLKETPLTCGIPVIVLTGRREMSIERQMRSLGADQFFTKPYDWKQLRSALETYLGGPRLLSQF